MSWQQIGSGTKSNIASLGSYDSQVAEGGLGYTRLHLSTAVPSQAVWVFQESLKASGVNLTENLSQTSDASGHYIHIYHRRGIAPLVIIAAAVAVAIVIYVALLAWGTYKWVANGGLTTMGWQIWAIAAVLIIGVVVAVVLIAKSGKPLSVGKGGLALNAPVAPV